MPNGSTDVWVPRLNPVLFSFCLHMRSEEQARQCLIEHVLAGETTWRARDVNKKKGGIDLHLFVFI